MPIDIKRHGAHICIISRNQEDHLADTLKSINNFTKIRSINYVSFNKQTIASQLSLINRIIYINDHTNKAVLLNKIFKIFREKQLYRIVILWEGEVIIGNPLNYGWSSQIGSFLKISTITSSLWQVREFNLLYKWYFKDPYGEIPSLDTNQKSDLAISRIMGEYSLIDITQYPEDYPLFFANPHYIYRKACFSLLKGEMDIALHYFKMRLKSKLGNEIISRCYLAIAIIYKIKGLEWSEIKNNIRLSLKNNLFGSLEAIYFLLSWALE